MDRYTKHHAEAAFENLRKAYGKPEASYTLTDEGKYEAIPGAWQFDYNATYGGARVEELLEHGGVTLPFGDRLDPRTFCIAVRFLLDGLARDDVPGTVERPYEVTDR